MNLSPLEKRALRNVKAEEGRYWKSRLRVMWEKAHYPGYEKYESTLQHLRNCSYFGSVRTHQCPGRRSGVIPMDEWDVIYIPWEKWFDGWKDDDKILDRVKAEDIIAAAHKFSTDGRVLSVKWVEK